eukprot:763923-Hanusia_phi.AAC.4
MQHPAVVEDDCLSLLQPETDFEPIGLIFHQMCELLSLRVRPCCCLLLQRDTLYASKYRCTCPSGTCKGPSNAGAQKTATTS